MKIIRNKFLPVSGFKAINLWSFIFARKDALIDDVTMNHEAIHSRQIFEVMALFAIPFMLFNIPLVWLIPWAFSYYIWYGIEWLVHLIRLKDRRLAYRAISFEKEAYANERDDRYLYSRCFFSFIKFYK